MTNCWKDQNPPNDTSLIWVKLNENGDIHGYFKYEGGKWIVKKRKELEEETSGSTDYSELINSLATVATTGSYNDLTNKPEIPAPTSFKPFKSSWPTNSTIDAFCQAVMNDPDAVVGMAYFGALSCSDLPAGLGIGDTIIEILGSNNNKVVHLEISSTNMAPYNWEASYWQGNLYGWRTWENTDNKVTSISNSSTDTQYPSAKAVYDSLSGKQSVIDSNHKLDYGLLDNTPTIPSVPTISTDIASDKTSDVKTASPKAVYNEVNPPIVTTQPVGGFLPNVIYDLNELTGTVTFALASASDNNIPNPYHWTFDTGSTAPTITWPNNIIWPDGVNPTVEAYKHYEVLVRNGYGSILVFSIPVLP